MNQVKAAEIVKLLKKNYPAACCSLKYKTPIQLVVATMLSAQSTDKRVNMTTPALFKKYGSIKAFATANQDELEKLIKPVGLYRNKANSIIKMSETVQQCFGSRLPRSLKELQTLPGIGRKSANVIQGELFGKPEGIAVDTHVARLSFRLGLSNHSNPKRIEVDLMKWIPKQEWVVISHLLIYHGRAICHARKPQCDRCPLRKLCSQNGVGELTKSPSH